MLFLFVCFCQMLKEKNSKSVVCPAAWWFAKRRQSTSRNDVVMKGGRSHTAPQSLQDHTAYVKTGNG